MKDLGNEPSVEAMADADGTEVVATRLDRRALLVRSATLAGAFGALTLLAGCGDDDDDAEVEVETD